ncbi:Mrp/NBP35 family ATP-binding protein [Blastomonas sp. SL216]|uniref:Mrp/NBP35 family ATP-binding protein n=1 Tax=Blastomonas sp. SL216 TaxID=2995169 RepID=UPI00406A5441
MAEQNEIEAVAAGASEGRASAVKLREGGVVSLVLDVAGLDGLARDKLEIAVKGALLKVQDVTKVQVAMTAERRPPRLIVVGSGKGGVGKSTFSANLAVALHRAGRKVGLVDADIYGPSQPRLFDCEDQKPTARDQKLVPVPNDFGVPILSMGHLVQPGQAIAWRGPMAGNALGQLIDAHWGDITDIIVDLPPGTGDVQLSMLQKHKPAGAVIVSTPQDLALMDAVRAISLFEQGSVPIIGLIENMAGYVCPHCGELSDPFGIGGAEAAAKSMNLPFLGRVPLDMAIRKSSDAGVPPASGEGLIADSFGAIAARISTWIDNRFGTAG